MTHPGRHPTKKALWLTAANSSGNGNGSDYPHMSPKPEQCVAMAKTIENGLERRLDSIPPVLGGVCAQHRLHIES